MEKLVENRKKVWDGILMRCFAFNSTDCKSCIGCQRYYILALLEQYIELGEVYLDEGVKFSNPKQDLLKMLQRAVKRYHKPLFTNLQVIEILDAYGLNEVERC